MLFLNKPEYFYRPGQVLKRVQHALWTSKNSFQDVRLPFGSTIRVNPKEEVGRSLCTFGIYDLVVTEALLRLLVPGELAMDIGANIGYTTAVMASQIGSSGKVISFEPSSRVFENLMWNVQGWSADSRLARIEAHQTAISSCIGNAWLSFPAHFRANNGVATLQPLEPQKDGTQESVRTVDLDSFCLNQTPTFLKLDVEGHELSVIQGARRLLSSGGVRDVVFEDHGPHPSAVQEALRSFGFRIYGLSRTFRRMILTEQGDYRLLTGVPPNFLATRDPERATRLLADPGWRALHRKGDRSPRTA